MKKFIIKIFITILIILVATYGIFLIQTIFASQGYTPANSDAIVILGYSLENGETPSDWLVKRLETGVALYNDGYSDKIIVTGGQGPSDNAAVSLSMKKWLMDNGIPANDILYEDKSKTTYENFIFVKRICEENNFNSIIVVTNDFHMHRSMLIASEFFDEYTGMESTTTFSFKKIISTLREPVSLFKYYFIDKNSSDNMSLENIITFTNIYL